MTIYGHSVAILSFEPVSRLSAVIYASGKTSVKIIPWVKKKEKPMFRRKKIIRKREFQKENSLEILGFKKIAIGKIALRIEKKKTLGGA